MNAKPHEHVLHGHHSRNLTGVFYFYFQISNSPNMPSANDVQNLVAAVETMNVSKAGDEESKRMRKFFSVRV